MTDKTIYELVGGESTFRELVERFYAKVEADAELKAVFPPDLEPGKRWQRLFLIQLFGGPGDYSQLRGHPRLRMRHYPFPIDQAARDRWLAYMLESIDEVGIAEPMRSAMRAYFEQGSSAMINTFHAQDSGQWTGGSDGA